MNGIGHAARRLTLLASLAIAASLLGIGCGPKVGSSPAAMAPEEPAAEAPPVPAASAPTGPVKEGVDIAGFDLGQVDVPAGDLAACQQRCDEREGCVAWTLYPADGACWLKSGVERLHPSVYAVSGLRSGGAWPAGLD